MGKQHKFDASHLVVQLENLLLVDSKQSRVVEANGGLTVNVPNQSCLAVELKKCTIPGREIAVKRSNHICRTKGRDNYFMSMMSMTLLQMENKRGNVAFVIEEIIRLLGVN